MFVIYYCHELSNLNNQIAQMASYNTRTINQLNASIEAARAGDSGKGFGCDE